MITPLHTSLYSAQGHPTLGPMLAELGVCEPEDLEELETDELEYLRGALDALAPLPDAGRTVGTAEAAAALGICERLVRTLCADGALPATRRTPRSPWRIDREQIARLVEANAA